MEAAGARADAAPPAATPPAPRVADDTAAGPPAAVPEPRIERLVRDIAVPISLHVVVWLVQVGMLAGLGGRGGIRDRLLAWDADWFIRIARDGYPPGLSYDSDGALTGNALAFFPLYPWTIRVVSGVPGISEANAALLIAWAAGTAAAVVVSLLGTRLYSRRTGYMLCVLFSAQPMAVVFTMAYSEALFCLLAVGMLLALHRGSWLVAGVLGCAAALTRPTGLAVAAALAVAALYWLWREGRRDPADRRYPRWRPVAGALLALAGQPAYLLWVGLRTGQLDAWFQVQQAGWGTQWDFGAGTARMLADAFGHGDGWVHVSTAVLLVGAAIALVTALAERVWLPLSVYGLLTFLLAVGSEGYYHSKPRMLVPVVLLLVPLAVGLARTRLRVALPVLVGFTLFGCWYGAYMLTVWRFTI